MKQIVAVCVAMDAEYKLFKSAFGNVCEKTLGPIKICEAEYGDVKMVLTKNGIGKVNAAISATLIIDKYHPSCLISSGVAGGSDENIGIGDIVVAETCSFHDIYLGEEVLESSRHITGPFPSDKSIIEKVKDGLSQNKHIKFGQICTGDYFVDSIEKINEIKAQNPAALAVDMETAALAYSCQKFKTPFCAIRIISDSPLNGNNTCEYKNFFDEAPQILFDTVMKIVAKI